MTKIMWRKLQDNPPFYLQFLQENGYEILLTDYITLYSIHFSRSEFISALKLSNSKLITTDDELLEKVTDMLSNTNDLKDLTINPNDTCLQVSMSKRFNFPVKLKLTLVETSKEIFFHKVTQPLLKTIKELQSMEIELRHSLKEKDEEIEKYKEEGAKIRKHWRTKTFNEEEYLKTKLENVAVPKDLLASLLEKKEEVANGLEVKQEHIDYNNETMKQEPLTPCDPMPTTAIKYEVKNELSQNSSTRPLRKKQKLNL